jgi:hypothetical protein
MTPPEGRLEFVAHAIRLGIQLVASLVSLWWSFYLLAWVWGDGDGKKWLVPMFISEGLLIGAIFSYIIASIILMRIGKVPKISIFMAISAGCLQGVLVLVVLFLFLYGAENYYPSLQISTPMESDMFLVIVAIYCVFFAVLSSGISSLAIAVYLRMRHN